MPVGTKKGIGRSDLVRDILMRYTLSKGTAVTTRTTTVFMSNRTQAVRLPTEMRLPAETKRVLIRACGQERIISPAGQGWNSFFIDGPVASEDFIAERASQTQTDRERL